MPWMMRNVKDRFSAAYCGRLDQLYAFLQALPPVQRFVGKELPQHTLTVLANYHGTSMRHLGFRGAHEMARQLEKITASARPRFTPGIVDLDNVRDYFPNLDSYDVEIVNE
jgi:hypothetical protein